MRRKAFLGYFADTGRIPPDPGAGARPATVPQSWLEMVLIVAGGISELNREVSTGSNNNARLPGIEDASANGWSCAIERPRVLQTVDQCN